MSESLVRDFYTVYRKESKDIRSFRIAREEEMHELLVKKLKEEVIEYAEDCNAEELADVLLVIETLGLTKHKLGLFELISLMEDKKAERGGFSKRYVLER